MKEIASGQLVRLKSGGPVMTVNNETAVGWLCIWFVENEKKDAIFQAEALEEVSPNEATEA